MPITQVAAIYSIKSKLLQRTHIPSIDDVENDQVHIAPGETMVKLPIELWRSGGPPAMQKEIGEPSITGICAVVHKDTKTVIDRIIWDHTVWDPKVHKHPDGHDVVPSDKAIHGDEWDGEKFWRSYAHIHPEHGHVVKIDKQLIDNPKAMEGHHLKVAGDLKVGDPALHLIKLQMLKAR